MVCEASNFPWFWLTALHPSNQLLNFCQLAEERGISLILDSLVSVALGLFPALATVPSVHLQFISLAHFFFLCYIALLDQKFLFSIWSHINFLLYNLGFWCRV